MAAISVFVFHLRAVLPDFTAFAHAYLAVDFFFLLSGFVIDHAYAKRLQGQMTVFEFVKIRSVRLYPLIICGAVIGLVAVVVGRGLLQKGQWTDLVAFPFAVLALPTPSALLREPFTMNAPAWSLFFELVANAVFALLLFRLTKRQLVFVAASLAVAYVSMGWALSTVDTGSDARSFNYGFTRVAFPFVMGMLISELAISVPDSLCPSGFPRRYLVAIFATPQMAEWQWLFEVFNVVVVFPLLVSGSKRADVGGYWLRVAVAGGFLSYPLYILHMPLLKLALELKIMADLPTDYFLPTAIALTFLIAWKAGRMDERLRVAILKRRRTTEVL